MIIWFMPNDLVRDKWLFGSHQMIWFAPTIIWFQPMIWFVPNNYLVQAKWFGARQMIIWFKPNDLARDKWLFGSSQMIWFAPNDYLVRAKWFAARQMIIWFKPNNLVRAKWLFVSSQMIWRAPIKYFQLKYIFWRCPWKSSVAEGDSTPYIIPRLLNNASWFQSI